ncbi:MAG: outer membrane beta-barrel protein [Muribaculaceae bacterium]|nr:outer membrane beta-barrel protein [Muribaculaceae bacterium]
MSNSIICYASPLAVISSLLFSTSLFARITPPEPIFKDSIEVSFKDSTGVSRKNTTNLIRNDSVSVNELQELTVTAKRPDATVSAEKVSYSPAKMLSGQSNLYEALKSIPGITIDSQGHILLNGMQNVAVHIDGRKTILSGEQLLAYLRATPTIEIEKIEIVNAVSARSEGSDPTVILNLQRTHKKDNGYVFGINLDGQLGKARQSYSSILADYKQGPSNTSLVYSNYIARNPSDLLTDRPYLDFPERLTQKYDRLRRDLMHNISVGYDYKSTSPLSFGTSVNYTYHRRYEPATMYTDIPFNPTITITTNNAKFITNNIYGEVYMKRNLSVPNSNWTAACNFFNYRNKESQLMEDNSGKTIDGNMSNTTYGIVGIFDLQRSLSTHWQFLCGVRISYVRMNSLGEYLTLQNNESAISDIDLSDSLDSSFGYNENVNGIYSEVKATYGIVNISGGIRAEQSNLNTDFSGNESAERRRISRHYFHLYPSLNLILTPETGGSWMLSYAHRVNRPRFADLDPFIHLFDDITHVGGNINLKAATSHVLTIAWSDNRRFRIGINGEINSDEIVKCYRELTDRIVYVSPENLPLHLQGIVSLSCYNLRIRPWWELAATANIIYSNYHFPKETGISPNVLFTPAMEIKNILQLPYGITGEVTASYRGPVAYGQVRVSKLWNTFIGIRKTFLNGKLGVSVYVKDIFNSNHTVSSIYLAGRKALLSEKEFEDMRKIGLSISYNLNGGEKSNNEKRNTWFEELNRVNL